MGLAIKVHNGFNSPKIAEALAIQGRLQLGITLNFPKACPSRRRRALAQYRVRFDCTTGLVPRISVYNGECIPQSYLIGVFFRKSSRHQKSIKSYVIEATGGEEGDEADIARFLASMGFWLALLSSKDCLALIWLGCYYAVDLGSILESVDHVLCNMWGSNQDGSLSLDRDVGFALRPPPSLQKRARLKTTPETLRDGLPVQESVYLPRRRKENKS
ncbi:hypothetical protein RHMOL_Rhmol07G0229500 [Rhododendron molle]|uniref:Uncharacterized protein n=1 Tax=Rhododendron molle TaxID=49168 RepID=A0ACC0N3N9_RHOML|nr:hypothetical protein RHMOL_Rhmol07G0229500 [Rhododendron molle]